MAPASPTPCVVLNAAKLEGERLTFDVTVLEGSLGKSDGPASVFIDTLWWGVGSNGFTYYGQSQTTGGITPNIGDPHGTSTFTGWSNPSPTGPYVPPGYMSRGGGAGAPPPPDIDPRYQQRFNSPTCGKPPAAALLLRPSMTRSSSWPRRRWPLAPRPVGAGRRADPAAPATAATQAAPQAPKTIGSPQQPQIVPSMIVLNARAPSSRASKLTLDGISPNAIVFADRPVRSAGHALTAHLLEEWSSNAPDSFAKTPPNATVSVFNKAKAGVVDAVVVLKSPKLEGDKLTFDVDVLEGDLAGGDGAVVGLHGHHQPADRATHFTSRRVVRRRALASVAILRVNAQTHRQARQHSRRNAASVKHRCALWHAPSCALIRAHFDHISRARIACASLCKE